MDLKKHEWNESYLRKENHIFFPKEEVVKFLARYVRQPLGAGQFRDLIKDSQDLQALDVGCGVGSTVRLFSDFGMKGYGVDISSEAIRVAKEDSTKTGYECLLENFHVVEDNRIPFDDQTFQVVVSDSVLDSMPLYFAKQWMQECYRVLKPNGYFFLTLIGSDNNSLKENYDSSEEIVERGYEKGTVQSYFDQTRIENLTQAQPGFVMIDHYRLTREDLLKQTSTSRYFVTLQKIQERE